MSTLEIHIYVYHEEKIVDAKHFNYSVDIVDTKNEYV